MSRATAAAFGVVITAILAAPRPAGSPQSARPNILFVLADDLDAAEMAFLPKVKALIGDQGVRFTNYFVNVSLCCPSRATTLRGQYAHNSGVMTNGGTNGGFETAYAKGIEKSTIATWLQAAGYETALYGKYLNGYPNGAPQRYVPPGWTDWASAVGGNPYSEYNYLLNENGRQVRHRAEPVDYGTDVYASHADAFIRRAAAAQKPFFIYLSVYAPHNPATPAPRHAGLFPNVTAPRPPSFNEDDVGDKPAFVRDRQRLGPRMVSVIDDLYGKRLRSLQAVDEAVARLVETLKTTGQLDRTFIVFASDNGFHLGQHRLPAGKQTAYEEDIRVPLVLRGPGVPAGRDVAAFAGNVDLAPTFVEIGGAAAPEFVDGRSLLGLAQGRGQAADWRQSYLIEHWTEAEGSAADESREPTDNDQVADAPQRGGRGRAGRGGGGPAAIPEFRAVRTSQYLYVEYVTGERELYDLTKDPYELTNLAPRAAASVLQPLADRLKSWASCAAATCRSAGPGR